MKNPFEGITGMEEVGKELARFGPAPEMTAEAREGPEGLPEVAVTCGKWHGLMKKHADGSTTFNFWDADLGEEVDPRKSMPPNILIHMAARFVTESHEVVAALQNAEQ